ncbi:MAG: N-acetyltransferase [Geminicoccaceae bacterium]|nr:N-acetyltransferase [Geminicoccaceae bacterium]
MDLAIREERPGDANAIRAVLEQAFGRAAEADLVDALRASGDVVTALVAIEAEKVVGHVTTSRLDAPMRAVALAPVAVRPERQGRGIGSRLIEAAIAAARAAGEQSILLLGEPAFYGRFGFRVEAARGYACAYAGPFLMALTLDPAAPMRGRIDYPAPFSALG